MFLTDIRFCRLLSDINKNAQIVFIENRRKIYEDCKHQNLLQYIDIECIEELIDGIMKDIDGKIMQKINKYDVIAFYEKQYHDSDYFQLVVFLWEQIVEKDNCIKDNFVANNFVANDNHYY